MLGKTSVNRGAWGRIRVVAVYLLDQTCVNLLVDKSINQFRRIVLLRSLEDTFDGRDLVVDHVLLVAWTTNTISVNGNLGWKFLVDGIELSKGLFHERHQDVSSIYTDSFFLLGLRHRFSDKLLEQVLLNHLRKVLSKMLRVGCSHTDDGALACVDDINTNHHGVLHRFGDLNPVQVIH